VLYAVVEKRDFPDFVSLLISRYGVIGPRQKGDQFVFAPVKEYGQVALNYGTTILPPKKFFLPHEEILLEFDLENQKILEDEGKKEKRILLGLHPCDIRGLQLLDLVFSGQYRDSRYFTRRANNIIIGYDCDPQESCFCQSMDADEVDSGFDLFFTDLGECLLVRIGSAEGDNILRRTAKIREVTSEDLELFRIKSRLRKNLFVLSVDRTDLPDFLDLAYKSNIWDELGEKCFSCGTCSIVCPTCYCFSMVDESALNLKEGRRYRHWDSCLFRDFALVAGGYNFRRDASTRIKLRYYHKQRGFVDRYGRPSCVGCGRCIKSCLARINLVEVINRIKGETFEERRRRENALQQNE